jgi:hypothetical protein
MKINWKKLKALSFETIDQFSQVADFLNKKREYFYTVLKLDLLFFITLLVLAGVSVLLYISIIGWIILPFAVLTLLILLFFFGPGVNFALVHLLMKKEKPTVGNMLSAIFANLGFIFQLIVTSLLFGLGMVIVFLVIAGLLSLIDIFLPLVNLTQLFSKIILIPVAFMVNFVYIVMSIMYVSGKKGWLELPENAIDKISSKKQGFYAIALALSFIIMSLPLFFNGLIFIVLIYPLVIIPLIQCLNVMIPYFYLSKA